MGSPGQSPTVGTENNVVVKVFGFKDMRAVVSWRNYLDFYSIPFHIPSYPFHRFTTILNADKKNIKKFKCIFGNIFAFGDGEDLLA